MGVISDLSPYLLSVTPGGAGALSGGAPGLSADKSLSGGVSFSPVAGSFGLDPVA